MKRKSDWTGLLQGWRRSVESLFGQYSARWNELWLPPVSTLRMAPPDPRGLAELQLRSRFRIDPEIIDFYQVTDGWPLWLGSFLTGVCRVSAIDLFTTKFPDAASTALRGTPTERVRRSDGSTDQISSREMGEALVVSEPDSREIVLLLPSGETCLYLFDSTQIFPDFYAFMISMRDRTLASVEDSLRTSE